DNSFQFQSWTDLAGASGHPAAGNPATMVTEGQQHVFYRGADGAIYHIFWNAADNTFHFQNWTDLARGAGHPAAGNPATMVTDGQQHVFYRGADAPILHDALPIADNSFQFQSWTDLAGASGHPAAGNPATMVTEGQQHVF